MTQTPFKHVAACMHGCSSPSQHASPIYPQGTGGGLGGSAFGSSKGSLVAGMGEEAGYGAGAGAGAGEGAGEGAGVEAGVGILAGGIGWIPRGGPGGGRGCSV